MKILIIGGAKFIGKRLVNLLLPEGHEITLLHRTDHHDYDPRVKNLVADRNDGEAVRQALRGHRYDAVYDIAYDWARGTSAQQVVDTVKAIPFLKELSRYIFISSSVAYVPGIDLIETDPLMSEEESPNPYVKNKAASERALFSLNIPLVTIRPPHVYGPENPFYREAFFFDRIQMGRPIVLPGEGDRLLQFVFVDDLASALVHVLHNPRAVGQAFNIAHAAPVTQLQLVDTISRCMGKEAKLVPVPKEVIEKNGGYTFGCPPYFGQFGQYYNRTTITQNIGKMKNILGISPSTFEEGISKTCEWWKKSGKIEVQDFSFEDKLMGEVV